jgi:hypothetical protein
LTSGGKCACVCFLPKGYQYGIRKLTGMVYTKAYRYVVLLVRDNIYMIYNQLLKVLSCKTALTGNLFRHVFISKQQLQQTVTLYDSDVDEYYYLTLQVTKGTSVLDDDRIVFVKEK